MERLFSPGGAGPDPSCVDAVEFRALVLEGCKPVQVVSADRSEALRLAVPVAVFWSRLRGGSVSIFVMSRRAGGAWGASQLAATVVAGGGV